MKDASASDGTAVAGCCLGACLIYPVVTLICMAVWGCIIRIGAYLLHLTFHTPDWNWVQCMAAGFIMGVVVSTLTSIFRHAGSDSNG